MHRLRLQTSDNSVQIADEAKDEKGEAKLADDSEFGEELADPDEPEEATVSEATETVLHLIV